jgi:predicted component of type VI protein secretion system
MDTLLTVKLTAEQAEALQKIADTQNQTLEELAQMLVVDYITDSTLNDDFDNQEEMELDPEEWAELQQAIAESEEEERLGIRFTMEDMRRQREERFANFKKELSA